MQKFQNILSFSPNHGGPLRDTKTSKFFSPSLSQCNSEKLIRTLNIRSSLVHLHGFHLILLLWYLIEITSFVCTNRIDLLQVKWSLDRLSIDAKGFLKLSIFLMLIKQGSITSQPAFTCLKLTIETLEQVAKHVQK